MPRALPLAASSLIVSRMLGNVRRGPLSVLRESIGLASSNLASRSSSVFVASLGLGLFDFVTF
jgi:hypothetical protein